MLNFETEKIIRVGSRRSNLAMVQTQQAIHLLKEKFPKFSFEVIKISTVGDVILNTALSKIGDKGLFTKELEIALVEKQVDFVVHSLKDVPTTLPAELVLGCVFDRVSPEDVVLMSPTNRGLKLSQLPPGSVIGTSALRRVASLSRLYPHLKFSSIRGNLNTRLAKLDGVISWSNNNSTRDLDCTKYDAIILAKAGVERLGWGERIDEVLTDMCHAVGQGALTCECRRDDSFILEVLSHIHSEFAALTSIAERSLMRQLDGGCLTPIGVKTTLFQESDDVPSKLTLQANIWTIDGSKSVEGSSEISLPVNLSSTNSELELVVDPNSTYMEIMVNPSAPVNRLRMARAESLGMLLANNLLESGGREILSEIRSNFA